ncbi:MAG: ABC-2 family transporter protein [Anaerolineaceae bacterium]|nr:ABC-2 family transporter protein [Anaerolineaceae bacterium]
MTRGIFTPSRGGWALIRSTWLSWMQYRSFFFILAFGWMIPPLIYLLVWSTAAGEGSISGMTRGAFVAYYLILILVNQITYAQTNWTVGDLIRYGQINKVLLRPIPPLYDALASEFAGKVVYLVFVVPILVILAFVLKPELDLTLLNALAFIPALIFAWALRFFWGYWLALLAFWATRADALLALQDSLVFLLAGQVAPVALLPGALKTLAVILPFRYMVAFPVEVITGQLTRPEMLTGFAIQVGWMIAAVILYALLWRFGLKRYSAVGG